MSILDRSPLAAAQKALETNPDVVASAANMAQSTVGLVPVWKASTAYTAGQRVISPGGDIVSAITGFTSGATYNAANWTISTQDGRIGAVETVNTTQDGRLTTLEATAADIEAIESVLVAVTDSNGRRTWLEANDADGGPTEWAKAHIRTAAGTSLGAAVARGVNRKLFIEGAYGLRRITSDPAVICCWGDSLTDGDPQPYVTRDTAWPNILDTNYAGGTVFNAGLGSLCADEIAFRQGGYVLTIDAATIPASGPVTITVQQVIRWRLNTWNFPITIAGIPGTFAKDAGVITFTRTAAGTATPVPSGEPIRSDWGTQYAGNVQVIFAGRNDINQDTASPAGLPIDRTVAATVAMVERLTPLHPRVLLVGTTTSTTETAGTQGYTEVLAINNTLRDLYPDMFYDLRAYLVNECIYDLGITPTAPDLTAMAGDTLPPSIMVPDDVLHFDAPAHGKVGLEIYQQLTGKGWIPA